MIKSLFYPTLESAAYIDIDSDILNGMGDGVYSISLISFIHDMAFVLNVFCDQWQNLNVEGKK